jgi:hypothetical protein
MPIFTFYLIATKFTKRAYLNEVFNENKLVKDRYNAKEKEVTLPILWYPDDCDLRCSAIIATCIKEIYSTH